MRFRFAILATTALGCLAAAAWLWVNGSESEAREAGDSNVATKSIVEKLPSIEISVTGVKPNGGVVQVAIFDKEEGFPDHQQATTKATIQPDAESVTAKVPFAAARCAVAVYQDSDGNGQLTKGPLGIPKERYGFSNNARGAFGPPKFADAVGESEQPFEIRLK